MFTIKGTNGALEAAAAAEMGANSVVSASSGGLAAYPGPMRFFMVGMIFSAQTGLNYRKFKKGEINRDEFKTRLRRGAFTTTGNLAGSTSGMVGGFFFG